MSKPVQDASSNQSLQALARLIVFVVALSLSSTAQQQQITLRFVDYQSGKPIGSLGVLSVLRNGKSSDKPAVSNAALKISGKTTKEGFITIPLPAALPVNLEITCLDTVTPLSANVSVADILKNGVAIEDAESTVRLTAAPGEVLILTRKLTARDRIRQEFP